MKNGKIKEPFPGIIHNTTGKPFSFKKSLLFISLHKCATRLFSQFVLRQLPGRTLINFQRMHYMGFENIKIKTWKYGYAYGVIRILDSLHPSFQLTNQLLDKKNLDGRKIIFYVRDPRDILVSMYYSFGFSHPFSPSGEIRAYQQERRRQIQQMTIDQYVLRTAPVLLEKFNRLITLMEQHRPQDTLLLKYEDMIYRFDHFYRELSRFVPLNNSVRDELFNQTRPPETEQPDQHKRKGAPGDYQVKLDKKTLPELDRILEPVLKRFEYTPWENHR